MDERIERELALYVIKQFWTSGFSTIIIYLSVVYLASFFTDVWVLVAWLSLGCIVTLPRFIPYEYILKYIGTYSLRKLRYTLLMYVAACGFVWMLAALLFLTKEHLEISFLICICLSGMVSFGPAIMGGYLKAYYLYVFMFAFGMSLALFQDGFYFAAMIILTYGVMLCVMSTSVHKVIYSAIKSNIENSELASSLEKANQEIEASNRAKSKFLAAASHDLRQPLCSLGLCIEVLEKRLKDTAYESITAKTANSFHSLNDLFDTLMELSSLDAQVLPCEVSDCYAKDIFPPLVQEYEQRIADKGLEFKVDIADVTLQTDAILFVRALRNILDNALKYTESGKIILSVRDNGDDMVEVAISDTGIGIDDSHLENIFDEYYQVNNPQRDRSKGLGLGLSVVKSIVNLLGHDVSVSSEKGKGTSFKFLVTKGVLVTSAVNKKENQTGNVNFNNHKFLIIDDDPDIVYGISILAESWGAVAVVANSKSELEAAINEHKDIFAVVSDYSMYDDFTGFDAIQICRDSLGELLPAIIISGDLTSNLQQETTEKNCSFLKKPIKPSLLKQYLIDAHHMIFK